MTFWCEKCLGLLCSTEVSVLQNPCVCKGNGRKDDEKEKQ